MKDLLNIETLFKVLGSIVASFMLLATPEKVIVSGLAIMLVCVFFLLDMGFLPSPQDTKTRNRR